MKTVILAGGLGTRLSEETETKPKPMVEIGGKPILWHIMNIYADGGFKDFVIACGYKGALIKEYFSNYFFYNSDWSINLKDGSREVVNAYTPDWHVDLVDTGLNTMTGGRILRIRKWVDGQTFMVTYGDGLSNVDIGALLEFHRTHGKIATVTAVRPTARFGALEIENGLVNEFSEKPQTQEGWINGGFLVFEPSIFDYIRGDDIKLEREPLEALAADGQLAAFRHTGFWQPMDTIRDKRLLERLWESGQAPWPTKL